MGKHGSKRPPTGDYEIGYGKPPVSTRFQKGTSGNREGRPKKAKSGRIGARALLADKLRMRRVALEGGIEVMRERIDILIDQKLNAFGVGKTNNLNPLFDLVEWLDKYVREHGSSDGVDYGAILRKKFDDLAQRQEERRREEEDRKRQGLPPLYEH